MTITYLKSRRYSQLSYCTFWISEGPVKQLMHLDRAKQKVESKRDDLQTQVQQMQEVQQPLLLHLAFNMLLSIIGISTWRVGFIPQNAWA